LLHSPRAPRIPSPERRTGFAGAFQGSELVLRQEFHLPLFVLAERHFQAPAEQPAVLRQFEDQVFGEAVQRCEPVVDGLCAVAPFFVQM